MTDNPDQHWPSEYFDGPPMLTAQWPQPSGSQISGMLPLDPRVFEYDAQGYGNLYGANQHLLQSPSIGYAASDMDTAGTPSSVGYAGAGDSFTRALAPTSHHLPLPEHLRHGSGSAHSPRSSHSGVSPRDAPLPSPQLELLDPRPSFAPEQRTTSGKHKGNSDEDDDDYMPSEVPRQRGRKRQRIPHTAVERRYRENLNAHLEKLRHTVPSFAVKNGPGGKVGEASQTAKLSKCEILNGAIEYISAQNKQVERLKNENQALRARLDQMQNWYRANSN
ncbi:hypothetical protein LTR37_015845 [Vermiconidia calcicola]|uniref:Uncharacterized protein n=1 Tax=Vermiconidia calcicola TaxID=1690605 RepID=A0ACC3MR39_9PEZI|nr:hypothetical protein LTR37_015845 [Vermiconidia calcicola]